MHRKFDLIVVLVFLLVQWRVNVLLLRLTAARLKPAARPAARWLVILFDVCLGIGLAMSFSELVSKLRLPPRLSLLAGAAALFYFLTATAVLILVWAWRKGAAWLAPKDTDPGRRKLLQTVGTVAASSPLVVLGYGALVQRTDFRVREIDLPLAGLPADLSGLTILQLSDIHLSAFLTEREFARVVDASIELRPNVALITGDLISSHGDPLDACLRQIARLRSDAGIFGCMGNHERYADAENYTAAAAAKLGIRFLRYRNEPLRFGASVLNLAGIDYQSIAMRPGYLANCEEMILPGACNLLMSHNPDVFPVAARQGYNLLLAGHTHGGQVNIEILDHGFNPARFATPFVYGTYRIGGSAAYVTRGIGTIGIPARIGAPPEITLLRLRKA